MATCDLCHEDVPDSDLADHVRNTHPHAADEGIYESDGSVIVQDAALEPLAEYDPKHATWQRD
ncbi:MAG: hypothetical protein SYR96_03720 [Actinomycetota bacterium]|nr:hypothetical protein [Actinomycetota bacterium]